MLAPPEYAGRHGADAAIADPLPVVRRAVRQVLQATPEYSRLPPDRRRALASAMVQVGCAAANLIREEAASERAFDAGSSPVARSLAEPEFGRAASRVAGTTRAILNAVSFPRFVTDLINGVFKAMNDSNQAQLESYINLLNAVAASTEGFADANMGPARARQWIVEHYPDAYELESEVDPLDPDASPEERAEHEAARRDVRLQLRSGGRPPPEEVVRTDLGMAPGESVPSLGNPEAALVPLVRSRLAKMRQEMLATLVQMGMQRLVVDSGRIYASMRFHIDTRDAVARDEASRFGLENEVTGSGSFGYGPWGASASVRNNISYVSTQKSQSTSEMNTDLDLNSAVEINFKSDYLPLNKLATSSQAATIKANSRNPEADADAAREKRIADARSAESKRSDSLTDLLRPAARPPDAPPGGAGGGTGATQPVQPPRPQGPPTGTGSPPSGSPTTPPPAGSTSPRTTAPPSTTPGASTPTDPAGGGGAGSSTTPPPGGATTAPGGAGASSPTGGAGSTATAPGGGTPAPPGGAGASSSSGGGAPRLRPPPGGTGTRR
jgi:hypothetical protein